MPLRLYNTRTHRVEPVRPLQPDHVRIYVCGLTPSAEGHLGHARSFLFFDVLRRYLTHPRNGYRLTFVKNVTDIDDRSIATAQQEGTTYDAVMARHYASFRASMRKLGVQDPDHEPFATAYVPQIVEMIAELVERGYAYATADGVYYRVAAFPRYGALSGKNVDELLVGARIAENEHKDDPLDFALWKFAKPGEPRWDSPWGAGRPGWHIECSAMSRALLGVPFDIHGGGYDLIFPHHENEIAQSEALMDAPPMAEMWVHGGLLNFDGRKMSKSLGNFEPLSELLERHDPLAIRLLFLQTGYRKPMNFTEESIAGARAALEKSVSAYRQLRGLEPAVIGGRYPKQSLDRAKQLFFEALDDDMNTSGALGAVFEYLIGGTRGLIESGVGADAADFLDEAWSIFGIAPALQREPPVELHVGSSADFRGILTITVNHQVDRFWPSEQQASVLQRLRTKIGDLVDTNGQPLGALIQAAIERRLEARKNKDFALSDQLRDALASEGITLRDSKEGTTWTLAGG
jgi:cysteinyl-tRNA synthetase